MIPNDFRDFLSIISFVGFLAISLRFLANITWLEENLTGLFLVIMGMALVGAGKLFTIKRWVKDGIKGGEIVWIVSAVFGIFTFIIGGLILLNVTISQTFSGIIGIAGVIAGLFIILDYIVKNTNR